MQMRPTIFLLIASLALLGAASPAYSASGPRLFSGIYAKGHNVTEPRPQSSKFMKVVEAGFLADAEHEAYYVEIHVSADLAKPYFMRATFEDPRNPKSPFVEEAEITDPPNPIPMQHGPVKGLEISHDYTVTIEIFRAKGYAEPIDRIVQNVRAYIDTTGPTTKVKKGMKGF